MGLASGLGPRPFRLVADREPGPRSAEGPPRSGRIEGLPNIFLVGCPPPTAEPPKLLGVAPRADDPDLTHVPTAPGEERSRATRKPRKFGPGPAGPRPLLPRAKGPSAEPSRPTLVLRGWSAKRPRPRAEGLGLREDVLDIVDAMPWTKSVICIILLTPLSALDPLIRLPRAVRSITFTLDTPSLDPRSSIG